MAGTFGLALGLVFGGFVVEHDQRVDGDADIGGRRYTFDAGNNNPRISFKVWTDELA
jgi:hypothetical protein